MADIRRTILLAAAVSALASAATLQPGQGDDTLSGPDRQPYPEPTPRAPSKPVKPRRKKHRKGSRK